VFIRGQRTTAEVSLKEGNLHNEKSSGLIYSTESFGSVAGPGIRFVVFTQGCRMACKYCHNSDIRLGKGDAESVLREAEAYRAYWGTGGGITVSGGEPLL
jgi:pyruvate formate lyase activating enzyme